MRANMKRFFMRQKASSCPAHAANTDTVCAAANLLHHCFVSIADFGLVGGGGEKRQGHPSIPSRWSVLRLELPIRLKVQRGLHLADRENEPDLWADTNDARFERAQLRSTTPVGTNLLIEIADG